MTRPTREHWLWLAYGAGIVVSALLAYFAIGHLWQGVYWSAPFVVWMILAATAWGWRGGYRAGRSEGAAEMSRWWSERSDPKLEGFGEGYRAAQETYKILGRHR